MSWVICFTNTLQQSENWQTRVTINWKHVKDDYAPLHARMAVATDCCEREPRRQVQNDHRWLPSLLHRRHQLFHHSRQLQHSNHKYIPIKHGKYTLCLKKNCTPEAGRHKIIKIISCIKIFHTRHHHLVADWLSSKSLVLVKYQLPGFHGNQAAWQTTVVM